MWDETAAFEGAMVLAYRNYSKANSAGKKNLRRALFIHASRWFPSSNSLGATPKIPIPRYTWQDVLSRSSLTFLSA